MTGTWTLRAPVLSGLLMMAVMSTGCIEGATSGLIEVLTAVADAEDAARDTTNAPRDNGTAGSTAGAGGSGSLPGGASQTGGGTGQTGGTPPTTPGTPASPPAAGGTTPPSRVGTTPPPSETVESLTPAAIAEITPLFADNQFTFAGSSASSSSDRFLSASTELSLCGFGRFSLHEFISFSSAGVGSSTSFTSENDAIGTWRITGDDAGLPVIELTIEESTSTTLQGIVLIEIASDAAGNLFLNNRRATASSIAADCAQAARQQR